MPQTLIELGGNSDAPLINIAPANGFVPETYLPMIDTLTSDYRVISLPPRALWGDGDPPEPTLEHSWLTAAQELVAAYQQYDLENVIAIGHSIGGVMTLLAALQDPDRFRAIIMLDPVILPQQVCDWMRSERQAGRLANVPMVQQALRRRPRFRSVEDAFQQFHGKSIFTDWSDEVLRLYCEHGTYPCTDDERCLTWSPEWEAFYYGTYYTDIWDELPKLQKLSLPMLFIAGGTSDTYVPRTVEIVSEIVTNATHEVLEGYGHMFPQAAPEQTANIIRNWLDEKL